MSDGYSDDDDEDLFAFNPDAAPACRWQFRQLLARAMDGCLSTRALVDAPSPSWPTALVPGRGQLAQVLPQLCVPCN